MQHQSKINPDRETVGKIYRDAQFSGEKQIICGDMNYELRKGLVEDLNDTILQGTKDFEGRPFYITVYERRDLQMKNAFIRRLIKTVYRPYPEADTIVFKVIPYTNEVFFCWHLPARYEMINMLNTPELRIQKSEQEELQMFKHWENERLEYYGFMKNEEGNWKENPLYKRDTLLSLTNPDDAKVSLYVPTELVES